MPIARAAMEHRDNSFESQCQGKIGHATLNQAKKHAKQMRYKTYTYRAYHCKHCWKYHVGRDMRVFKAS